MKKFNEKKTVRVMGNDWENTQGTPRTRVRNFMRFALESSDADVFYFSLGGMVMPLSVSSK